MGNLKDICKVIKDIANCSSTKAKQHILSKHVDDELFKKILVYTYDTNLQYGIKQKTIDKMSFTTDDKDKWNTNIWKMLEELASSNINNELVNEVEKLLCYFDEEIRGLLIKVMLKDLRFGMNIKSINSAIPGLIPTFGVMLAESYEKHKKAIEGKEFILSTKLDGGRLLVINRENETFFYTRAGKRMDGLVELEEDFKQLPNGCYDGELIAEGKFDNSAEQYKATMKRSRIKGRKTGLKMMCYDFVENEKEFWSGKCNTKCIDRKAKLQEILENGNAEHVEYLYPLYIGSDVNMIEKYSAEAIANGEEGIMCSIADSPYETKRTKALQKVKIFRTADVLVTDIIEGTGKYENMLGAIKCKFIYNGEVCEVEVGSGWNEDERKLLFDNPSLILNKVITIKTFEVSRNSSTGKYSLRFPTINLRYPFMIRTDKSSLEDTNVD